MRPFFLIALAAGLLSPTAAKAESYWLVISNMEGLEKIQMQSMAQCEEQGSIFQTSKRYYYDKKFRGYECLKGK